MPQLQLSSATQTCITDMWGPLLGNAGSPDEPISVVMIPVPVYSEQRNAIDEFERMPFPRKKLFRCAVAGCAAEVLGIFDRGRPKNALEQGWRFGPRNEADVGIGYCPQHRDNPSVVKWMGIEFGGPRGYCDWTTARKVYE